MSASGFAILVAFVVVALAAGGVAFLKGRPVLAAFGPSSIVVGIVLVAIGRWTAAGQEDGLVGLGYALGYATFVVILCSALLVAAVVGALLPARPESRWFARGNRDER